MCIHGNVAVILHFVLLFVDLWQTCRRNESRFYAPSCFLSAPVHSLIVIICQPFSREMNLCTAPGPCSRQTTSSEQLQVSSRTHTWCYRPLSRRLEMWVCFKTSVKVLCFLKFHQQQWSLISSSSRVSERSNLIREHVGFTLLWAQSHWRKSKDSLL